MLVTRCRYDSCLCCAVSVDTEAPAMKIIFIVVAIILCLSMLWTGRAIVGCDVEAKDERLRAIGIATQGLLAEIAMRDETICQLRQIYQSAVAELSDERMQGASHDRAWQRIAMEELQDAIDSCWSHGHESVSEVLAHLEEILDSAVLYEELIWGDSERHKVPTP